MVQRFYQKLKEEYSSYSRAEKFFILSMMICSFALTAEAAITRAVANSVFLSAYTAAFFPTAWLISVPIYLVIVVFYNRFLPNFGCGKMLALFMGLAITINLYCAFYLQSISWLPLVLYLWKEIFIILIFQQLWSVCHATVNIARAKYLYGIFVGVGGCGSALGSLVPGFFAVGLGTEKLLLTTIPIYLIVTAFYFGALAMRTKIPSCQDISILSHDSTDVFGGMKLIHRSRFLILILVIVLSMQISTNLMDYQFSMYIEREFIDQDIRTQFLGRFFGMVNTLNIGLQFVGGFLIVYWMGLQGAHFLLPIFLAINGFGFLLYPTFQMMCFSFGTIKALDYSLFAITKEMLYIPLKVEEKFKAKAIIDVFAYRSSKALASLLILLLQCLPFMTLELKLSWTLFSIFLLWTIAVAVMFKYYDREVEKQSVNWPEQITE